MKTLIPLLLLLFIATIGCDSTPTEVAQYDPEPVLTAYMETGQPVGEVYLEWVWKYIESYYDVNEAGIKDATMTLFPVSGTSTRWDTLWFEHDLAGRYLPVDTAYVIEAGVRYRMEVDQTLEDVHLTAETTAPDTFSLNISNPAVTIDDTTLSFNHSDPLNPFFVHEGKSVPARHAWEILPRFNRNDPILRFHWSESAYAGGRLISVVALTDTSHLRFLDPDKWDEEPEPEDKGRSGVGIIPEYQQGLDLFWIFFEWVGAYRIELIAASEELYRYSFTSMPMGPPTTSQRPESNVEGGLGIFGVTSTKTMYWYMQRTAAE